MTHLKKSKLTATYFISFIFILLSAGITVAVLSFLASDGNPKEGALVSTEDKVSYELPNSATTCYTFTMPVNYQLSNRTECNVSLVRVSDGSKITIIASSSNHPPTQKRIENAKQLATMPGIDIYRADVTETRQGIPALHSEMYDSRSGDLWQTYDIYDSLGSHQSYGEPVYVYTINGSSATNEQAQLLEELADSFMIENSPRPAAT